MSIATPHALSLVYSPAELAIELGTSRRTVNDWIKDPSFPRESEGFPVAKCVEWKVRRELTVGGDDLKERRMRAECDKLEAEAKAKQLRNAILEGELYDAREIDLYLNSSAALVKTRLELAPDEIAAEVPPKHKVAVHECTTKIIRRILLELSTRQFHPTPELDDE